MSFIFISQYKSDFDFSIIDNNCENVEYLRNSSDLEYIPETESELSSEDDMVACTEDNIIIPEKPTTRKQNETLYFLL